MDEAWVVRNKLISVCEDVGFVFITIDLRGFKSGSMNIVLKGQNSAYEHGKVPHVHNQKIDNEL